MAPESAGRQTKLFQFALPGLPGMWFGIPTQQVKAVISPSFVQPVPLSPSHIIGICPLENEVISIIDLTRLLSSNNTGIVSNLPRLLIVDIPSDFHRHTVAFPIMEGAGVIDMPVQVEAAQVSKEIVMKALYAVVYFDERDIALLDLCKLSI